ncbi:hypothetical protein VE02_03443 [Pseudogymnoascus sp. 03VT05]|nr:hypothetical protein VE02_03443 [Pseudogymnoascus sp. 03VT05]
MVGQEIPTFGCLLTFRAKPLRQLYPNPGAEDTASVDIIAVHGLNYRSKEDHAWDTWRTPPGNEGRLWLRDDLPKYVPEARIFLYEYNSTAAYGNDRGSFSDKANELLEAIRVDREDLEARPILLLGHSMGGLLIKQALINAAQNNKYKSIQAATKGLAFFATPHYGGKDMYLILGGAAVKIAMAMGFQKGDNVLETLKNGSIFSDLMHEQWRHQLPHYEIVSFWGDRDDIVTRDSARLNQAGDKENIVKLNADHSRVCKFGSSIEDQDNFKLVRSNIRDLYKVALERISELNVTAPGNIREDRMKAEDDDKELKARWAKLKADPA